MALPIIPIISALTSLAPTIGKLIAGDKGEDAAQAVADIARKATGQNDVDKAVKQIQGDPKAQLEFLKMLEQNKVSLDKMYLEDVQHAREAHEHSKMPSVIVIALTLMVAGMGAALFLSIIPAENETLANILFGAVLAKWADSIAYFVGSSRGSAEKTRELTK